MNDISRIRRITWTEAIAALCVMTIWSAILLSVLAIALSFWKERSGQVVMALERPTLVGSSVEATVIPARWPTPLATTLPLLTGSIAPVTSTSSPMLKVDVAVQTALVEPGIAQDLPTSLPSHTPTAAALSTPTPKPTSTPTRVVTFTPEPDTPTPLPTETPTPVPDQIVNGHTVHTVAPGETLASLATRYVVSIEALMRANQLKSSQRLKIGQKLVIPEITAAPSLAAASVLGDGESPRPAPSASVVSVAPPPAGDPPTRIVIPKIRVDTPVVPVGWKVVHENGRLVNVWEVADYAAGWHRGSALPGNVGNMVISGHHNIKGEVFRYLVNLENGNEVDVYVGNQRYPYVVTEKHILREKGMPEEVRTANARWIAPTTDQRLTLVTCWPYTTNTHRVIIVCRPAWR